MSPAFELLLILTLGALQPILEIAIDARIAALFNVAAALIVCAYLGYVIVKRGKSVFREWGMRTDNFFTVLPAYALFTIVAGGAIFFVGRLLGNAALPYTFWYLLAVYPVWGLAQQFALQNLLARNLITIVPNLFFRALVVASFFAIAHLPSLHLALATFIAGLCFVPLYHRYPNLIAIGIAHGILGSLVFHLILGQNQWEILMRYLF